MKKFILAVCRSFQFWLAVIVFGECFWALELSLRPYLLKKLTDSAINLAPQDAYAVLFPPVLMIMLLYFMRVIVVNIYVLGFVRINSPMKYMIGSKIMAHIMYHSHAFFNNRFIGNISYKIRDVMNNIPEFIRLFIDNIFAHSLSLLFAMIAFSSVGAVFVWLILVWIGVVALGTYFFTQKIYLLSRNAAEENAGVVGHIADVLGNMNNIRLFSSMDREKRFLHDSMGRSIKAEQWRDMKIRYLATFQEGSFFFYQVLVLIFLVRGYRLNTVTPGDFVLLLSINKSMARALRELLKDVTKYAELIGNIKQGLDTIYSPFDIVDAPDAQELIVTKGEIIFDNVSFCYPSAAAIFQEQSVTIPPGQKVGLVGYSGSGKSTFVNLILRLYDVTTGQILIDGQNISSVTQDSLRKYIGLIPQDPSLFHRSIKENIRYGSFDASDDEVIEAAKKAFAHDFIMQLSEGYDTVVGDRGSRLSGGQRQRIALARAVLKNAPILILDEATSQLDSLTENQIQESLEQLMDNKTTLVIAHRLSTLLSMDRILVFDQGKIIEDGTHKELLALNGLYRKMWLAQVGGFLIDS